MKIIKSLKIFALVLTVCFIGLIGQKVKADEMSFSVTPILPSNQIGNSGYFNLLMHPGDKQTVEVKIVNLRDTPIVVEENVSSATTNLNGVVEYSPNQIKPDSTLKYNMKDLVSAPAEISLSPKETKTISIAVNMPNAPIQGLMAGGLTYQEKSSNTKSSSKSKGVSIINKYNFVIAFLMQQSETKSAPDLKMNDVEPGQVNYRNVINANLQNPNMAYLNTLYVQSDIKGISNSKLEYKSNKEMMQMAPNSNFDFPVALGSGTALQAGKYHMVLTAFGQKDPNGKYTMKDSAGKVQKFNYKWTFERDFTITAAKAKELNAKDVTIKHNNSWWIWLIAILLILIILFLLFFILWKRRKKDDDDDKEDDNEVAKQLAELKSMLDDISDEPK